MDKKTLQIQKLELNMDKLMKQTHAMKELEKENHALKSDNTFKAAKLRFLEKNGTTQSAGSIGMTRMQPPRMPHGFGNMEDEEGEQFNNTYLNDLKGETGSQMSLDRNNVYSAKELQQRNSMYPTHMRSSYAIGEIDGNLDEREIRVSS